MNTAGVARPSGSAGKSNFALQTGILVAERRHNGGTGRASQLLKEPADSLQGCNAGGACHFQTFGAFDKRLIGPWSLPQSCSQAGHAPSGSPSGEVCRTHR